MNILVPTDFSDRSIELVEKIGKLCEKDTKLLFTHLFYLPDGIQDMLFASYRLKEFSFVTPQFRQAYLEFIGEQDSTNSQEIPIRFFYGNTMAFFKIFLKANSIDVIAYSENKPVKKLNSSSIDCNSIIKKCGLTLLNVDNPEQFKTEQHAPEKQHTFSLRLRTNKI